MQNKKPPFTITEKILTDVMEICELVGKVSSTQHLSSDPVLRRQNRIKTIYSSLAIEQNTLSLEQVTAVLSGKRVLAPPKDIAEESLTEMGRNSADAVENARWLHLHRRWQ